MKRDMSRSAEIWLALLKEGGRQAAAELGADAPWVLNEMAKQGAVQKYAKSDVNNRVRFGVTADCIIPRGVTIGDIIACNLQVEAA